ncbi:MAG: universal stress protein [Bacteroidota bacterium]
MHKILIPTELTYLSKCALQLGVELAELAEASIEVLSAIATNESVYMEGGERYHDAPQSSIKNISLTESARAKMHQRVEEIASIAPELELTPKILFGDRSNILIEEVANQHIDLVIMGGDLYNPADKEANKFLKAVEVPVLVLKCMISGLSKFKDIIFLVDANNDSSQLVKNLKVLQQLLTAKIHLLHVKTPKRGFLPLEKEAEPLEQYAERNGFENVVLVEKEAKTEIEGLREYCETIQDAFVALGIHERSFLQSLISGDKNYGEIIANSIHPLWLFRN